MFLNLIFVAITISSLSFGFAIFLNDHPKIKLWFERISKFFVCGVCQVFWFSLSVFFLDTPQISSIPIVNFIIVWQITAFFGYLFRYISLLILEGTKFLIKRNTV